MTMDPAMQRAILTTRVSSIEEDKDKAAGAAVATADGRVKKPDVGGAYALEATTGSSDILGLGPRYDLPPIDQDDHGGVSSSRPDSKKKEGGRTIG